MPEQELNPEDQFRDSLKDVIAVVEVLTPFCKSVDDLIGVCRLALSNDGQLALLMGKVYPVRLRQ